MNKRINPAHYSCVFIHYFFVVVVVVAIFILTKNSPTVQNGEWIFLLIGKLKQMGTWQVSSSNLNGAAQ